MWWGEEGGPAQELGRRGLCGGRRGSLVVCVPGGLLNTTRVLLLNTTRVLLLTHWVVVVVVVVVLVVVVVQSGVVGVG